MLTYCIDHTRNQLTIEVADPAAFAAFVAEHATSAELQSDQIFLEALETLLCNGLSIVQPEAIGALTDSIILSESCTPDIGESYPEDAKFYWFPGYMLRAPLQDLITKGKVIFDGD